MKRDFKILLIHAKKWNSLLSYKTHELKDYPGIEYENKNKSM
jgi:hypothetical protein